MSGHIATAGRTDWCTPQKIVDAAWRALGGCIDLDPCSNVSSLVGARREIRLPADGLAVKWTGRVYVNPPFGRDLPRWVDKCRQSYIQNSASVVLLLPAAVDTRLWHDHIWWHASRVCFLRGRLRFVGASASAPMACAVVYWGQIPELFDRAFAALGRVLTP